jgi:hypothetical protein
MTMADAAEVGDSGVRFRPPRRFPTSAAGPVALAVFGAVADGDQARAPVPRGVAEGLSM